MSVHEGPGGPVEVHDVELGTRVDVDCPACGRTHEITHLVASIIRAVRPGKAPQDAGPATCMECKAPFRIRLAVVAYGETAAVVRPTLVLL